LFLLPEQPYRAAAEASVPAPASLKKSRRFILFLSSFIVIGLKL